MTHPFKPYVSDSFTPLKVAHAILRGMEVQIRDDIADNLQRAIAEGYSDRRQHWEAHDRAFAPYNNIVQSAWLLGLAPRAVRLWLVDVEPVVSALEAKGHSFHKGAPLANAAVALFVSGDYPRAAQFFAAADEENLASRGRKDGLSVGDGFTRRVLIDPIAPWIIAEFGPDYESATGRPLVRSELDELMRYVSQRVEDGMLLLSGLWRLSQQVEGPDNEASRLQRARALADVLIVVESALRRWQVDPALAKMQLHGRLGELLRSNPTMFADYNNMGQVRYPGANWESTGQVNTMLTAELARFDANPATKTRLVIASYVVAKLRNALLHILDESLDVYSNRALLFRAVSLALVTLYLGALAEKGPAGIAAL